jgi:hypothetical protein
MERAGERGRPPPVYPPLGEDAMASRRRAKIRKPAMAAPKIITWLAGIDPALSY